MDAPAHVAVAPRSDGFNITKSHLVCRAKVPGIDQAAFMQHAEAAKAQPSPARSSSKMAQ